MFPKYLRYVLIYYLFSLPGVFAQNYAVSLKASTVGVSLEGVRSFGSQFNARAGLSYFSVKMNGGGGSENYSYDAKLKLLTISALADWFPFDFNMHVTGGAFINLNKGDITLWPTTSHQLGGTIYTPEMMGTLAANVEVDKISPYLGIGFGSRILSEGLEFSLDVGALYQGAPRVDLTANGLLEPSAEQGSIVEHNVKWFKFYPIVAIGIIYKFI